MIKTVIFDIGQVLMSFEWENYVQEFLKDPEIAGRVNKAIMTSGIWNELDVGIRLEEEILSSMIALEPSLEKEIRMTFYNTKQAMGKQEYAIPWILELKNMGYQVLFLSNYSKHVMKAKWEVLDFLPYMDGGIFSFMVHEVKPNLAIYQMLRQQYQLDPKECLFIDDKEENVKAAQMIGMHGFVFEGYEKSYPKIMELLKNSAVGL